MRGGHYFAYIRPGLNDEWYEFNDMNVSLIPKTNAFRVGYGGEDSKFDFKDLILSEKKKFTETCAYMLIYIRDSDRDEIMNEVHIDEIP